MLRDVPRAEWPEVKDFAHQFAEYVVRPHAKALVLPHTVTPEAFAGKGVASRLAQYAMAYARERGLKVIPTCPFFAQYIREHPEYNDLLIATAS